MPVNKNQMARMVMILEMIKTESYPNSTSILAKLRGMEGCQDSTLCSVSERTIHRDIQTLKNVYRAPIEYDPDLRRYFICDPEWTFDCAIFGEEEQLAAVMGARLAADIFPEPFRSQVLDAVDRHLQMRYPAFLDTTFFKSLKIISGLRVRIVQDIFITVFNCWVNSREMKIVYVDPKEKRSERVIQPHALVFNDGAWFVKAFCHARKKERVFALHRIREASDTGTEFTPSPKIIGAVIGGDLFTYSKIHDVKLVCDKAIAHFLKESPLHKDQTLHSLPDGGVEIEIPDIFEHDIVRWVLCQGGMARALAPEELVSKVAETARRIAGEHTGIE